MEAPGERLIAKMWESLIDKGIGGILAPWQEKRLARARAEVKREEMLIVAKAEQEIELIKASIYYPVTTDGVKCLPKRIEPEINNIELATIAKSVELSESIRREVNVAKAIIAAEDTLALDSDKPSDQLIDEDWLYAWRENAGRVSSEELQTLWGKILAGEVKQPGTYSVRTLEFVRGLSKGEAELLEKTSRFVIDGVIFKRHNKHMDSQGITFGHLVVLEELGLLIGVAGGDLHVTIKFDGETDVRHFESLGSKAICVITQQDKVSFNLPIIKVTQLGSEVLKIGKFEVDENYLMDVAKEFALKGCKVGLAHKEKLSEDATIYREYHNVENPNARK